MTAAAELLSHILEAQHHSQINEKNVYKFKKHLIQILTTNSVRNWKASGKEYVYPAIIVDGKWIGEKILIAANLANISPHIISDIFKCKTDINVYTVISKNSKAIKKWHRYSRWYQPYPFHSHGDTQPLHITHHYGVSYTASSIPYKHDLSKPPSNHLQSKYPNVKLSKIILNSSSSHQSMFQMTSTLWKFSQGFQIKNCDSENFQAIFLPCFDICPCIFVSSMPTYKCL